MRLIPVLGLCAFALLSPAAADDAPFLNTDPASVMAQGELGLQQWFTWAHGHAGAAYNAFEAQTEFDYGMTDRLMLAVSLLYDWEREHPAGGPAETESLPGLAAEAIYIVLPTDTSPVGVALAADPSFNAKSRAIAFRVLLTKYLGGFENVLNINFDNDWEKDDTGYWQGASGLTFNYGLGYALDKNWTLSLELGNELAFDDLYTSGHLRSVANTFFLGPTIEYDCELAVVTLGAQWQLPWSSGDNVVDGYTTDAERFRLGLRVARAI